MKKSLVALAFSLGALAGSTRTLYHFALQIDPKMRRYFPRRRDETFAGRFEEVVASAGRRTGRPPRRSNAEKASSSRPFGEQVDRVDLYCELVLHEYPFVDYSPAIRKLGVFSTAAPNKIVDLKVVHMDKSEQDVITSL